MLENSLNTTNTQETSEEKNQREGKLIRLLEYRNPVQMLVFEKLQLQDDMDAITKYSKMISQLIDDNKQTEIRQLILDKKFKEAAEQIIFKIRELENIQKAA